MKMGDELTRLIEIFHKIEEAGGQATLTLSVTTQGGKTKTKLETESPPSASEPAPLPPASSRRRRRRRRCAAARSRLVNQQAAGQQTSLAEDATSVPLDPTPPDRPPLHHLLSPSPSSRRRRVMSLGRPAEMTSFASLNLDGHCSPPPLPTPPPVPMAQDILEKLQRFDSVGEVSCSDCGEHLYSIFYSSRNSTDDDECDRVHLHDQFPGEKVNWTGKRKATGDERLFRCGYPTPPSKLPLLP